MHVRNIRGNLKQIAGHSEYNVQAIYHPLLLLLINETGMKWTSNVLHTYRVNVTNLSSSFHLPEIQCCMSMHSSHQYSSIEHCCDSCVDYPYTHQCLYNEDKSHTISYGTHGRSTSEGRDMFVFALMHCHKGDERQNYKYAVLSMISTNTYIVCAPVNASPFLMLIQRLQGSRTSSVNNTSMFFSHIGLPNVQVG